MREGRTLGTLVAASLALLNTAPAIYAQEVIEERDPLQFMIDAPDLVGERVRVRGEVFSLSFTIGSLRLPGGDAILRSPWIERGDFARLIPACEEHASGRLECLIAVEATVSAMTDDGSTPILTDVDFIFDE